MKKLTIARRAVEPYRLTAWLGILKGEQMNTYRDWRLLEDLPLGWKFDNTAGSPLTGFSFANNGRSVLRGGQRALVRVVPAQKQLFDAEVACSKIEPTTISKDANQKQPQVADENYIRTVNELAREKFKARLLNDILVDLTICEIEGWCKLEYINELKKLINGIGQQVCIDA